MVHPSYTQHVKVIAAVMAICGFCVAIISGAAVGASLDVVLTRGLVAMASCYAVGIVIAVVAMRTVREHVEDYVAQGASGGEAVDNPGAPGDPHNRTSPDDQDELIELEEVSDEPRAAA